MQIFVLDHNPFEAARQHCDKHVVKMVSEYAQLLSTAHRMLDGYLHTAVKPNGKEQKIWLLPDERVTLIGRRYEIENPTVWKATHMNHPCGVWARQTDANYSWLFTLYTATLAEYTRRYHKKHKAGELAEYLENRPKNIKRAPMTPFAMAMPDKYKVNNDAVASYRAFYVGDKARFTKWTNTPIPLWFYHAVKDTHDVSGFIRTR